MFQYFFFFQFQFFWCPYLWNTCTRVIWSASNVFSSRIQLISFTLHRESSINSTGKWNSLGRRVIWLMQQQRPHIQLFAEVINIFFSVVLFCECYSLLSRWASVIWRSIFTEQVAGAWNESTACFVGFSLKKIIIWKPPVEWTWFMDIVIELHVPWRLIGHLSQDSLTKWTKCKTL